MIEQRTRIITDDDIPCPIYDSKSSANLIHGKPTVFNFPDLCPIREINQLNRVELFDVLIGDDLEDILGGG